MNEFGSKNIIYSDANNANKEDSELKRDHYREFELVMLILSMNSIQFTVIIYLY
jgi:hypothetical protein